LTNIIIPHFENYILLTQKNKTKKTKQNKQNKKQKNKKQKNKKQKNKTKQNKKNKTKQNKKADFFFIQVVDLMNKKAHLTF
jgi:hypothetical protein